MECVRKFKAALTAVPVSQPCTAAAVAALSNGAHDAVQELIPMLSLATPIGTVVGSSVANACAWQQLPAACMPVLAWLAAGLRGDLPAAAHQQAFELTCVLLGVVSLAVPGSLMEQVCEQDAAVGQSAKPTASRLLQTLGAFEDVCKQLESVASVLVVAVFPTGAATAATSSSSSSSNQPTELQQAVYMAMAWNCMARLMAIASVVLSPAVPDKAPAVLAALTGSGLYQVLLEGALLLLGVDPAAYSHAPEEDQLQLSGGLRSAMAAAIHLSMTLGIMIINVWYRAHREGRGPGPYAKLAATDSVLEPWMPPLFKLQMLVLAKLQWDARQGPAPASQLQGAGDLPAKPLARALRRHMVSPCVAGDLLQQRAPGLLPHVHKVRRVAVNQQGQVLGNGVVEEPFLTVPATVLSDFLQAAARPFRVCMEGSIVFDAIGALDLALLLEVTELYCLVCPPDRRSSVCEDAFLPLQQAVQVVPDSMRAGFAATYGEALLSIVEYLVEDVRLVSSSSSSSRSWSAAAADRRAATTAASGMSQHQTPETLPSSSSGSSRCRPRAGGRNPAVTLEKHRVWWAQDTVSILGLLVKWDLGVLPRAGAPAQLGGVIHSLFTATNAPRVSRLLEVVLRTAELQGPRLQELMSLLPWRLPPLHAAASSPEGSRALLSAATTAAKAQQLGLMVLSALVQAQGELAPAAAGVAAAVPGRMGQAVAQQLLQQPGTVVWQSIAGGFTLANTCINLMSRAAALLDPVLAPLAAYLAATRLLPGKDSKPWAVEAVLTETHWSFSQPDMGLDYQVDYHELLARDSQHMSGIMRELTAALSLQQAAAVSKQAATLVKKAGGGAAEAEQLRQQLQGMWLGRDCEVPDGCSATEQQQQQQQQQQLAAGGVLGLLSRAAAGASSSSSSSRHSSSSSPGAARDASQLPIVLQWMCQHGMLKLEEVLAAGDPAAWSSALGPTSNADLRVASTALLAACKAAGAVAQLPVLMEQLQPILAQQPWGREVAEYPELRDSIESCEHMADWALLLAPLLAVLLPAQQAADLQKAALGAQRKQFTKKALLTPATTAHVLGLLGHVAAPGVPGCSYPGCCNLEGRSEAELQLQLCTKCRGVRYCCREHQVAHWKTGHKEVCRAAQAAVEKVRQGTASGGP